MEKKEVNLTSKNFTQPYYKIIHGLDCPYSDKNGNIQEHVYIWWLNNKDIIYDSSREVIHHINGDIRDNRIENLIKITRVKHTQLHPRDLIEDNYKSIYEFIKQGENPTKICLRLDISKQSMNYYINRLKKAKLIRKIAYGTWETIAEFNLEQVKQVKLTSTIGHNISLKNKVRSHAFIFTLRIPKLDNWENRETYLKEHDITYLPLKIKALGQQIVIGSSKVWLTNKSLVIHESSDFLGDSAAEGKSYALDRLLKIIEKLESLLNCSFKINKKYLFKVSREHHSRLKDSLAKQYRKDGKKLFIYDYKGLWLWIDFSDRIDELEVGNRQNASKILDNSITPFFNGLEKVEDFTPQMILRSLAELIKDREYYAENLKSHIAVIRQLGNEVSKVASSVKKLNSRISQKKLTEY
jgi:hypothetical protein